MIANSLTYIPQVIIFDWDQTLVNSRPTIDTAIDKMLREYGIEESWKILKADYRGTKNSYKEDFQNFFGPNEGEKAYRTYLRHYSKLFRKQVCLMPAVDQLFEELTQHHIDLVIISNKEQSILLDEIEFFLPQVHFMKVIGDGIAGRNKPSIEPIVFALKESKIPLNPKNVWFIGDSQQDMDCAYAANCRPILIGDGYRMREHYLEEKKKDICPLIQIATYSLLIDAIRKCCCSEYHSDS